VNAREQRLLSLLLLLLLPILLLLLAGGGVPRTLVVVWSIIESATEAVVGLRRSAQLQLAAQELIEIPFATLVFVPFCFMRPKERASWRAQVEHLG
jgi:hypothetical protein